MRINRVMASAVARPLPTTTTVAAMTAASGARTAANGDRTAVTGNATAARHAATGSATAETGTATTTATTVRPRRRRVVYRPAYGPGYGWKVGHRYRDYYRGPIYVVNDYPRYHLRRPPYGHHWIRDDRGNMLLVAVATGIIADYIINSR